MELKTYFAQDRNGRLIPSASVAVFLTGTTTLATGLKNVSGGNLANPFTADSDGKIQFYAPDGIYDMQVSLGSTSGIKVTFQCLDVEQQLSGANRAADRAETARDEAEAALASFNEEKATLVADADLAANTGAELVGTSNGKNAQQIIDRVTSKLLSDTDNISTATLAGRKCMEIDRPMSVSDTDNQGAKVEAGTTIYNDSRNQNQITTTKEQSAFRIDGDNVTIIGVDGLGSAGSDNSGTSEFITTRMAHAVNKAIKNLKIIGVHAKNFTTGIHLIGAHDCDVIDASFEDMIYSPETLNSAGGYGVLTGGNSRSIRIIGLRFKANAYGRHAVYVSCVGSNADVNVDGSYGVTIDGAEMDYTAVDLSASDSGMAPINLRRGKDIALVNSFLRGSSSLIAVSDDTGPSENVKVLNNTAVDMVSAQNRTCAAFMIGRSDLPYLKKNYRFSGNTTVIKQGAGQPAGNDISGVFRRIDGLTCTDNDHTNDTGVCYSLVQCTNVLIDDIRDTLTDATNAGQKPVIYMDNCANVTIGANIRTNRADFANGKSGLVGGLSTCTDVTCNFPRKIGFTITNGVISNVDDAFEIISSGGITVVSSYLTLQLRAHVTQAATNSAIVRTMTANGVNVYITSTNNKKLTVNFLTAAGEPKALSSYTGRVEVIFNA